MPADLQQFLEKKPKAEVVQVVFSTPSVHLVIAVLTDFILSLSELNYHF